MSLFGKKNNPTITPVPIQIKKDRMAEYVPAEQENLTANQLKIGIWLVTRKVLFKKIGIGILITWCVASLFFSGYQWVHYFSAGYWQDLDMVDRQVSEVVNYEAIHPIYGAKDLQIAPASIFMSAPGKYDLISQTKNINDRWVVTVNYRYQLGDGETQIQQKIILPGEEQLLAIWGQEKEFFPSQARLEIVDIDWQKISPHKVFDVRDYIDSRLNFSISDFTFTPASREGLPINRLEFMVKNESAYSYWQADFDIRMLAGSEFVGAVPIILEEFKAGEERVIDLRMVDNMPHLTSIDLLPQIDVFDEREFMPPGI
jgi:hypothetical protein